MNEVLSKLLSYGISSVEIDLTYYKYGLKFEYRKFTTHQFFLPRALTKDELEDLFQLPSVTQIDQLRGKDNHAYLFISLSC